MGRALICCICVHFCVQAVVCASFTYLSYGIKLCMGESLFGDACAQLFLFSKVVLQLGRRPVPGRSKLCRWHGLPPVWLVLSTRNAATCAGGTVCRPCQNKTTILRTPHFVRQSQPPFFGMVVLFCADTDEARKGAANCAGGTVCRPCDWFFLCETEHPTSCTSPKPPFFGMVVLFCADTDEARTFWGRFVRPNGERRCTLSNKMDNLRTVVHYPYSRAVRGLNEWFSTPLGTRFPLG